MKQIIKKMKQISILLLVLSLAGCNEDNAILPQVTAGFTYTVDLDTRTVTFINTSKNSNTYTWSFDDQDATTSTLNNPVFTYAIGSYTVVLTATNVAGDSATFEDTIIFLDQEIPLITLIGDAAINVTLGDAFTDPGATALDGVDGDITANIVVGGDTVDTAAEGTYVITYDVSDSQGNAAIQVERTVIVTAISCVAETVESLSTSNLNITFMSDPNAAGSGVTLIQDNVTYEYVGNPDFSASANESCKVGKVTKAGVESWDNLQIDFADKITFTDDSNFTVKVYSPVSGYNVTFKLEDKGTAGAVNSGDVLSTTQTTKTNEWEELTIPFNAVDSGKYDKIVIFFDLQGAANTNTYYIDDLKLNLGSGGGGGGSNCVAETTQSLNTSDTNITFMTDPNAAGSGVTVIQDNTIYEYVDNPDFSTTANNSCKVGKITKAGVESWDNLQIDFADKFTFTDGSNFTIKVFSPVSGYKVTLKLEDKTSAGATNSGDRGSTATTTKTNEWEELTIPFSAADSGIYDKVVIFFDLEGPANSNTYYFDDLKLNLGTSGGGGGTGGGTGGGCAGTAVNATAFPVNFESCESFISTFTDAGSITTSLDDNPSKTGINTSDFVLKVVKASGSNRWAGFQNPFPNNFDATKTFKVKIYSTKANVVMRFEVNSEPQDNGSGNPGPQFATITTANTWTEVEFVITGIPGNNTGLNQLVIKPDNPDGTDGETTSSEGIYYFDDIRLE